MGATSATNALATLRSISSQDKDFSLSTVADTAKRLDKAAALIDITEDAHVEVLATAVEDLTSGRRTQREVFVSPAVVELKRALAACISLREEQVAATVRQSIEWARREAPGLAQQLLTALLPTIENVRTGLVLLRGQKAQTENERDRRTDEWNHRLRRAESAFRLALEKATVAQWDLGPQFLAEIERVCNTNELWIRSIPWDPPRMVGWKLRTFGVHLAPKDLWSVAREFVAEAPSPASGGEADGSYFTDYVHYVAITCPSKSALAVTRQMIARLLRHAELSRIIKAHGKMIDEKADLQSMASLVIDCFGWRETIPPRRNPSQNVSYALPLGAPASKKPSRFTTCGR